MSSASGRMIGLDEVCALVSRSAWTVRRWRREGLMPEPDRRVGRTLLWNRQRFFEWLDGEGSARTSRPEVRQSSGVRNAS